LALDSQISNRLSTDPDKVERKFRELLFGMQKAGQLDRVTLGYFGRASRDRPGLLVTLKFIRDRFPEARVLDLGCGMGAFEAEICRSENYECVGVDVNRVFVKLASLRLKFHGYRNTSFILGDAYSLPVRTGLFQAVVLHDVAFSVNVRYLVGEVARVLKKGGGFIFDVPMAFFYYLIPVQRPFIKYSKEHIAIFLKKWGFVKESVFLPGVPPVLHERFHLPASLMRVLSSAVMLLPSRLQEFLGGFWFNLLFAVRHG
jgi:ubiquinone/menaquinone biosynthesis C-methylase UbiE